MLTKKQQTIALLSLTLISTLIILPVWATPKKNKPHHNRGRTHIVQPTQVLPNNQFIKLNSSQKNKLVQLFHEPGNSYIRPEERRLIYSQINSLPPGMYNRLRQGKGLPPGIAKKVVLNRDVVDYIGVDRDRCDVVVIGANIVLWDRIANVILDVLYDVIR